MMPLGNHGFAQNFDSQGSNNENTSHKYLTDGMLHLGLTYDFENPLYAREGIMSKIVKIIRKYRQR